jgi:hypothetical protein
MRQEGGPSPASECDRYRSLAGDWHPLYWRSPISIAEGAIILEGGLSGACVSPLLDFTFEVKIEERSEVVQESQHSDLAIKRFLYLDSGCCLSRENAFAAHRCSLVSSKQGKQWQMLPYPTYRSAKNIR